MATKFKLYPNKRSIFKPYSRQLQGGDIDIFEERLGWWERRTDIPKGEFDDLVITITTEYVGRPDLIAFDAYGRSDLVWLVLQYNNIVDINEELEVGRTITLPSKRRLYFSIAIRNTANFGIRDVESREPVR